MRRIGKKIAKPGHLTLRGWYICTSAIAKRCSWVKPPLIYVGDTGWVLSTIGNAIRYHLSNYYAFGPQYAWSDLRQSLVHFGSPTGYFEEEMYRRVHPSNKQVVSWTHGRRSHPNPQFARRLDNVCEASNFLDKIIVHAQAGSTTLLEEGVDRAKLAYIPHGIDTRLFLPPTSEERLDIRRKLGIPEDAKCIGSFQKDGEGWEEGLSPKWVKGPDVFLKVIDRLRRDFNIYVLLTGPARGYVKLGLEKMGVHYRHVFLKRYEDVARHYWALDLYVIASRDEGGPMACLESMATETPLVATRVGMCTDLIRNGENGLLADVDDVDGLTAGASKLLQDAELTKSIVENALGTVRQHDWSAIARRYHEEVYRPLMLDSGYRLSL